MVYSHSSKVQKQTKLNKMLFRDVCNHGEAGGEIQGVNTMGILTKRRKWYPGTAKEVNVVRTYKLPDASYES